ncbi:MAG: hypothetical protein IPH91_00120 [Elusimicrobia bacterium]|nr:hypothetical protein [Elusimicrobiota bacterium]MBK7687976.1 hypothetical protein [Elusimicrobiota bacterium]MBK8424211.1 hypothetical protein [Elusimicrobiota bacterium]MBK8651571.1 hypothetical protein [Elusimicrobiota bacterium]MBL0251074.1 hypothetical protein [Elusimicrobiota bacterium]
MKNIQVIDRAENCVYDIFEASDEDFCVLFPGDTNIAFIDEVMARYQENTLHELLERVWKKPIRKSQANGIHGILFFELEGKKKYYPERRDETARNPDGALLRKA